MARKIIIGAAIAAVLSGCGGSGSDDAGSFDAISAGAGAAVGGDTVTETLLVKAEYGNQQASLFSDTKLLLSNVSGFKGHAPVCSLAEGALPEGLHMNRDCSITGAPTKAGTTQFVANVGADGVKNSIRVNGQITVVAPGVSYPTDAFGTVGSGQNMNGVPIGTKVNAVPRATNWLPTANLQFTVSYAVISGKLAPGLSLDPATGVISGTVTTAGTYMAIIEAVYVTSLGTHKTFSPSGVNFVLKVNAA
jgi:hypothetical protein